MKPGAFVCLDVWESGDYYGASFEAIIKLAPSLLLRGDCLLVMGTIHQVRIVVFSYEIHNILLLIFQLASIEHFLDNQVELKLRADGDSFFNFYVMDVKSDGRHDKQIN